MTNGGSHDKLKVEFIFGTELYHKQRLDFMSVAYRFLPKLSSPIMGMLLALATLSSPWLPSPIAMAQAIPEKQAPPEKQGGVPERLQTESSKPADPPKSERQLAEERKAREAARKRGEITFDDLKFAIEKGGEFKDEMITPEIRELDKKVVKLRGFILPTSVFQQSGIKQFVLVRDNQECCFGPGAALYDCVIIEMVPGKTATFSTRVVSVKGKLEIDSESFKYPEGGHYAIYKMTAEDVR